MPRPPRYELVGVPQHVVQRGNNRQETFRTRADRAFYRRCLLDGIQRHPCDVHAYVLMGNHVHLLLTPREPFAIARLMQSVGRRYVRRFNDANGRTGTLWEGRYKASLVASEAYLFNCYRYIELNPVRAGLVSSPADYLWSSYSRNALGMNDPLVTDHEDYTALGEDAKQRAREYEASFVVGPDPMTVGVIRQNLNQCRAFGPDDFKARIEELLKRSLQRPTRGRPRLKPSESKINSV